MMDSRDAQYYRTDIGIGQGHRFALTLVGTYRMVGTYSMFNRQQLHNCDFVNQQHQHQSAGCLKGIGHRKLLILSSFPSSKPV